LDSGLSVVGPAGIAMTAILLGGISGNCVS
jgi:hypothetical protein